VGDSTGKATRIAPGLENSVLMIEFGEPVWIEQSGRVFWSLTGNAGISPTDFLGTTDANDLRFATNGNPVGTFSAATGDFTLNSLSGAPINAAPVVDDGVVFADAGGTLTKRDRAALLMWLGIENGRYENTTAATQWNVVITLSPGFVMDPNAAITITPEATSSVSATPFIVAGSRTASTFTVNFPGGLNPGEAINYQVTNP
jgi:hypothetical protein